MNEDPGLSSARAWICVVTRRAARVAAAALVALLALASASVEAATATSNAGSCSTSGANGSGQAWGSIPNAQGAVDNAFATDNPQPTTQLLQCSGFGFAIPAGNTINGITLVITRYADGTQFRDQEVRLLKAGAATGQNKASGTAWHQFTATSQSYGSAGDRWGTGWSAADINSAGFGAQVSVRNHDPQCPSVVCVTTGVDAFAITVTYGASPSRVPTLGTPALWLTAAGLTLIGMLALARGSWRLS
jgi:hypothetical protein